MQKQTAGAGPNKQQLHLGARTRSSEYPALFSTIKPALHAKRFKTCRHEPAWGFWTTPDSPSSFWSLSLRHQTPWYDSIWVSTSVWKQFYRVFKVHKHCGSRRQLSNLGLPIGRWASLNSIGLGQFVLLKHVFCGTRLLKHPPVVLKSTQRVYIYIYYLLSSETIAPSWNKRSRNIRPAQILIASPCLEANLSRLLILHGLQNMVECCRAEFGSVGGWFPTMSYMHVQTRLNLWISIEQICS